MPMQAPKNINQRVRNELILELADRGIDYTKLPNDLFFYRIRDILEYLKAHYGLTYCYRCQKLTNPDEMIGASNMCRKHSRKPNILQQRRFEPPREMIDKLHDKLARAQGTIDHNSLQRDLNVARSMSAQERAEINERFDNRKNTSVEDIMRRARKE